MSTKDAGGTGPGQNSPAAKDAKGAKKKGKKSGQKSKKSNKKKDNLKCGDKGTYGKLKNKTAGGKLDRHHIPSAGALRAKAKSIISKKWGGQDMCGKQAGAVTKMGEAFVIPKGVHKKYTTSYGQSPSDAEKASKNLQKSAKDDTKELKGKIKGKKCAKEFEEWAKKVNDTSNRTYTNRIIKAVTPYK